MFVQIWIQRLPVAAAVAAAAAARRVENSRNN